MKIKLQAQKLGVELAKKKTPEFSTIRDNQIRSAQQLYIKYIEKIVTKYRALVKILKINHIPSKFYLFIYFLHCSKFYCIE